MRSGRKDQDFRTGVNRFFHLDGTAFPRASIEKNHHAKEAALASGTQIPKQRLVPLSGGWLLWARPGGS